MVLQRRQRLDAPLIRFHVGCGIAFLVDAKEERPERCQEKQNRQKREAHERDGDEMHFVPRTGCERGSLRRLPHPGELRIPLDELAHVVANIASGRASSRPRSSGTFSIASRNADSWRIWRTVRPLVFTYTPAPGRRGADEVETVAASRLPRWVALARPENLVEALAGGLNQLVEVDVRVTSKSLSRLATRASRARRIGVRGNQHPREVDPVERAEVDHRPVRDAVAHRREELFEPRSRPGRTGAAIVNARWNGIGFKPRSRARSGGSCPLPVHEPEVDAGRDLADLVTDPAARRTTSSSSRGRSTPRRRTSSPPCRPSRAPT